MCLGNCSLAVPESFIKGHSPYLCGTGPTPEQAATLTAKLVTSLLKGKKAEFAGDALEGQEARVRRRALRHDRRPADRRVRQAEERRSTQGGVKIAADLPFLLDLAKAQENARTMIAKLKDAGRHDA